jgi:sigma-70-like protein
MERDTHRQLHAAISNLGDNDRAAIIHRYFDELSEGEMAVLLGCARGTVKSRLSRALQRLRRVLVLALALLVLLGGAIAASPGLRDAIAQQLALRGVRITHVSDLPDSAVPVGDPAQGMSLTALRTGVDARVLVQKLVPPGTSVEEVDVDGSPGYWISGAPHAVERDAVMRLAGNTLLWQQGDVTLRLEGAPDLPTALAVARTLR